MFKSDEDNYCYYCNEILTKKTASRDHLLPRCKGGKTKDNIVLCCKRCNSEKGSMTEDEYREYLLIKKEKMISPIPLDEIKISYVFQRCPVSEKKILKAIDYYYNHGKFDKPIKIKYKNKILVDGLSRYEAAKFLNIKEVPVTYAG